MTPLSHSSDFCKGANENLSAITSVRLGLKGDGGDVFKLNLYKARCAATAKEKSVIYEAV